MLATIVIRNEAVAILMVCSKRSLLTAVDGGIAFARFACGNEDSYTRARYATWSRSR